jgi:hypothetical protein
MDIKYILIIFLLFIFFIYGLTISEIIDFFHPDYDEDIHDYRIAVEMIIEIGVAYIIYYIFKYYYEHGIIYMFNKFNRKPPFYINQVLLIAFSFGIFKHLNKSNKKMNHIQTKVIKSAKEKFGF